MCSHLMYECLSGAWSTHKEFSGEKKEGKKKKTQKNLLALYVA